MRDSRPCVGALDEGRAMLDKFVRDARQDNDTIGLLARLREELGQLDAAVDLHRMVIDRAAPDPWTQVSARLRLVEMLVRHDLFESAFATLRSVDVLLRRFEDWKPVGLGRKLVVAALDVSLGLEPNNPVARSALSWATDVIAAGCSWSPEIRDKGVAAASRVGDPEALTIFRALGRARPTA
jgi:hypothetical protein